MEYQFLNLSNSSSTDTSDYEFHNILQGEYTRFDSFDDDIEMCKSDVFSNDKSIKNGLYFRYNIDNIVNPRTNNFVNSKAEKTNGNQSNSLELASKYDDEIVKEINDLQISNPTIPEKIITPVLGRRKRLQKRMSEDFSKFAKRPSFLYKLRSETYSGLFRKKSVNLTRTSSVPKIVIVSPKSPGHETDSGNDSDTSDEKQIDQLEKRSLSQKLHVSSKKKAMRKSI